MNGVICHSWQPPDAFFTALTVLDAIVAHPLFDTGLFRNNHQEERPQNLRLIKGCPARIGIIT